jgi:hypothetical protein
MPQAQESLVLKEEDMTLIITLQTTTHLVIAADGMGYSSSEEWGTDPYPVKKLHSINDSWVFGSCGNVPSLRAYREALDGDILSGRRQFDKDIDSGGHDYLLALHEKLCKQRIDNRVNGKLILAGRRCNEELTLKVMHLYGEESELRYNFVDPTAVFGSKKSEVIANTVINCLRKPDAPPETLERIACFAIWEASKSEFNIGKLEDDYAYTICVLGPEMEPPRIKGFERDKLESMMALRQRLGECV